jgi:ferredoxin
MALPSWFLEIIKKLFPQRFIFARLTRVPILGSIIKKMFFENNTMIILPKNQSIIISNVNDKPKVIKKKKITINQTIEQAEELVLPSQIVNYFIDKAQHHFIMNFCICREANKCQNYPRELGCLFLGEAVLNIDPNLGRLVTKEEAHKHVERCRREGLVHLIGRDKLDAMWLDVRPENKLLTICNCCECCCLWRMTPYLSQPIAKDIRCMPGVTVNITEHCTNCGSCLDGICFVDAIKMGDEKPFITSNCRGCGRCVEICPVGAIQLSFNKEAIEESKSIISRIIEI